MTSFTSCQLSRWSFNVVQTTSKSDLGDRISDVSWECPHLYLEQTTCDQINQDACRYQVWTACYSDKILPLSHSNLILIVLQRNNSANCWSVSDTKEISNEATIRRTRSQIMWWVQQMLCLKPVLSQKRFILNFAIVVFLLHTSSGSSLSQKYCSQRQFGLIFRHYYSVLSASSLREGYLTVSGVLALSGIVSQESRDKLREAAVCFLSELEDLTRQMVCQTNQLVHIMNFL